MNGMNKVILEGNISKIETKQVGEKSVTNFDLAVNKSYKDKNGETVEQAVFVPCQKWELSEKQLAALTKGKGLRIEGEIQQNIYKDANGKSRKDTFVSVGKLEFLPGYGKDKSQEQAQKQEEGQER